MGLGSRPRTEAAIPLFSLPEGCVDSVDIRGRIRCSNVPEFAPDRLIELAIFAGRPGSSGLASRFSLYLTPSHPEKVSSAAKALLNAIGWRSTPNPEGRAGRRSTQMGEILGLGCTHYPGLTVPDERLPSGFHRLLTAPGVPDYYKDPVNWPAELVAELGNDQGYSAAQRYSARMGDDFRAIRAVLDDFAVMPWQANGHGGNGNRPNRWGEPADWRLELHGHREAAKYLATGLIERGIDMAYAYKPLHHPLAHAFTNTFLYLDWDRRGFPYPVIPF